MKPLLTIFSCPKPFNGHIEIIQRNAIQSWVHLSPKPQVILMGDEKGVRQVAEEFKVEYISTIEHNAFGTPLLSDIFKIAQEKGEGRLQCYLNGDIILTNHIMDIIGRLSSLPNKFLGVSRRIGIDIKTPLDFVSDWQGQIESLCRQGGKLEHHAAIDCFIFPKGMVSHFPPFALGRPMWDNWFIYNTQTQGIPVVDLTPIFKVIHQNHDYAHLKGNTWEGPEADANRQLAGGYSHAYTIADSDYFLKPNGLSQNMWRHLSKAIRTFKTFYHRYVKHDSRW